MLQTLNLRSLLADFVPPALGPGVAVALVQRGQLVTAEGIGFRDLARQLPITPDTVFPICSLSKSFTSTAVMQLVERGLLSLDVPVRHYLPWFRTADLEASSRITPRMLMAHLGGMGRTGHQAGMWQRPVPYRGRADLVAHLAAVTLQTPPGTAWSYCNEGYVTLGLLVDTLSGVSLERHVEQNIFEPTGMEGSATSFGRWRELADRAVGYATGPDGFVPAEDLPTDYGVYFASGGVCSSARDLARYAMAALDYAGSPLLSAGSLAQMHTAAFGFGDTGWGYGFGWDVVWNGGQKVVFHSGGLPGFATYLLLVPDEQLAVAVLSNGEEIFPSRIAERVASEALGRPVLPRSPEGDLLVATRYPAPADIAAYTGLYRLTATTWLQIEPLDGRIRVIYDSEMGFPPTPAVAVGADLFLEQRGAMPLQFIRDQHGAVRGVLRSGHLLTRERAESPGGH